MLGGLINRAEQSGGRHSAIGNPRTGQSLMSLYSATATGAIARRCHYHYQLQPPITTSGLTVGRGLAFLSFLLAFFGSTIAIVYLLLYKPLEGGHDVISKLAANCPERKSVADVLWNVGNAPAGFCLAALGRPESVE
jgi:hypothetical protein